MNKEQIKNEIINTQSYKDYELYELKPNIKISFSDFENIISDTNIDLAFYNDVTNGQSGDYWHEVRDTNDKVLDHDAPNELTLDEWVDYLYDLLQEVENKYSDIDKVIEALWTKHTDTETRVHLQGLQRLIRKL